ncbi:flagellin lysine-N-methylase [Spirochaeta isovalerica]|uniref:Lysine-N-methylase n=1 Tax=Spirochaeta isovalerica TaxID=150 RepID=A0A841RE27_9SPIO|nr:flagellin lysine-N-methylase [Spirochaeta isovalerica]MBB6480878.1 lysine-N-methylase [Spirochaeta isovalerica]
MKDPLKLISPSYISDFKCIGGTCEDSCCIGWDIEIDKQTYKDYRKSKNPDLKPLISENVYRNKSSYSKEVDYGKIAIRENRWCPFLDNKKLCKIQSSIGEDSLSNVCYTFPRNYNILNGICELSFYMSCPEAVRKLLAYNEPIEFIESEFNVKRFIINSEICTTDKTWKNSPIRNLAELRFRSIEIMQDRTLSLGNRLIKLGLEMEKLSGKEASSVSEPSFSANHLDLLIYTIESLGLIGEDDSLVFTRYTHLVLDSFPESSLNEFLATVERVLRPFIDKNSHLFEHFLVNMIFQENFPFSVNENSFDGYVMLILRYTLILFYLTGIAAKNGEITFEDVVSMIQVHTKIINHHKSFSYNILQEIKRKGFDSMSFLSGVIL